MDNLLARDIILEARDNRAQIQTTINERNLSIDTTIGACPDFMSNKFLFIVPNDDENPRILFKKLIVMITSDKISYNTSQMLFCSLVGCFNDQWQTQLTSLLVSLSVTVYTVTLQDFKQVYDIFEDVDTDNLNQLDKMEAPHYVFVACLLYNLIGKSLTTRNFAEWMVRRQKTYSNPLGLQETDPLLPILCPKALFCARFYSETRTHWQLRRLHFITLYAYSTRRDLLSVGARVTVNLLRNAELTNLNYITTWILLLNPEVMLLNDLAKHMVFIASACAKQRAIGKWAPWMKLLLPNEETEEMAGRHLQVPYSVARALASKYGSTSNQQIEIGGTSEETNSIIQHALAIVKQAGTAKTLDIEAIRMWRYGNLSNPDLDMTISTRQQRSLQQIPEWRTTLNSRLAAQTQS